MVSLSVFVFLIMMKAMEQTTSSPLDLLLVHYPDVNVYAHNLLVLIKKSKLVTFCRSELPAHSVGGSPEGTFNLALIGAIEEIVFRLPVGHRDQLPYIVVWRDSVEGPTS